MKLRISHKIAGVMILVELLFSGILIFYMRSELKKIEELSYKVLKEHYLQEIKIERKLVEDLEIERFNNLIDSLQIPFSEMLFLMDKKGMEKSVKKILESPFVRGVEIYDRDLNMIFISAYKEENSIIFSKNGLNFENGVQVIEKNLTILDKNIGIIKIFYTLKPLNEKIDKITSFQMEEFARHIKILKKKNEKTFYILLSILAALIFFTLISGYLIFYLLVSMRLEKLESGLNKFFGFLKNSDSKVEKIEKVEIGPDDEICEMIDSINENIKEVEAIHNNIAYFMDIINDYVLFGEVDDNLKIINISDAFCNLLNIEKSYILGNDISKITGSKNVVKILEEVRKIGSVHLELNIKNHYLDVFISYNSNIFTFLARDITQERLLAKLNRELERKVEERTLELQKSHKTLQEMFKLVQDSIKYASIIQHSLLPKDTHIRECFEDYFIIYNPKDIVGVDIYLFYKLDEERCFVIVIDGVGHGVPGAFSSMFAKAIEAHIFHSLEEISVSEVLRKSNEYINELANTTEIGFDMGVLFIDKGKKILRYAGAKEDLFVVSKGEVTILKGNRFSIGFNQKVEKEIKEYEIAYDEISIYLTTDGFLDQIGGERNFSFGKKRFKSIIEKIYKLDMHTQKTLLFKEWYKYKNDNEQTDDVTVIGIKL